MRLLKKLGNFELVSMENCATIFLIELRNDAPSLTLGFIAHDGHKYLAKVGETRRRFDELYEAIEWTWGRIPHLKKHRYAQAFLF